MYHWEASEPGVWVLANKHGGRGDAIQKHRPSNREKIKQHTRH